MMHIHGMNAHHQEFIAHLKRHDEILYDRVRSHGPITFPSVKPTPKSSFIALCRAIVGQQLSTKAAATIFLRLSEWAEANGGLTPSFILKHNAQEMRNVGLSLQKASYLLALSNAWNDNEDRFESLHTLSNEQVIAYVDRDQRNRYLDGSDVPDLYLASTRCICPRRFGTQKSHGAPVWHFHGFF